MSIINRILRYLLYLYVIVLPLSPHDFKFKGIPLSSDTILALIFSGYFITFFGSQRIRSRFRDGLYDFSRDYLGLFISALLLIMFISISYAVDKKLALSETLRFLSYILLLFIIKYELNDKKIISGIIKSYLAVSTFLGFFGIWQYTSGFDLSKRFIVNYGYGQTSRIAATLDNPNSLGAYLVLIIFPIIMLTIHSYKKNKFKSFGFALLSLLLIVNLVLTGSRNALLGLIIGFAILILIYSWKLIFVFGVGGIISLFIPQISTRLKDLGDSAENISRIKLWEVALKMIKDHPILGVGNGNYVTLYNTYIKRYPQLAWENWQNYPTHNSYLKVESELGVFGILSFIGILISSALRVREAILNMDDKFKPFFKGFFAAMLAFFIMSISDNLFFVPKVTSYFWLSLAMAEALLYRTKSNSF